MKYVEIIAIPPTTLTLTEGERHTLTAVVYPDDATNKAVVWSSDNQSVASVDSSGIVYANHQGTANIYAHAADGSGVYDVCEVTVCAAYVPATGITLDKTAVTLTRGETDTIIATILPENATNKSIIWSSSNEYVAGVQNGVISARAKGVATVSARISGNYSISASCQVTVNLEAGAVESITLDHTSATLNQNSQLQLHATVLPANATNPTLRWSSDHPEIASVDASTGKVTAVAKGVATIFAHSTDGSSVTASCSIRVYVPVSRITVDRTELRLLSGAQGVLTATVSPTDADNKTVSWNSSDPTVATVENGIVQARSIGTATISAVTTESTGIRGTCKR